MSELDTQIAPNKTATTAETGTEYIVLGSHIDSWLDIAMVKAPNAHAAIREALAGYTIDSGGTYVAIPKRSWQPVTVKAETRTVLKLEQAT